MTHAFIVHEVAQHFLKAAADQGREYCLVDEAGPAEPPAAVDFVADGADDDPETWRHRYIYPAASTLAVMACDRGWRFLKRQRHTRPAGPGYEYVVASAPYGVSVFMGFAPRDPMKGGLAGFYRLEVQGV